MPKAKPRHSLRKAATDAPAAKTPRAQSLSIEDVEIDDLENALGFCKEAIESIIALARHEAEDQGDDRGTLDTRSVEIIAERAHDHLREAHEAFEDVFHKVLALKAERQRARYEEEKAKPTPIDAATKASLQRVLDNFIVEPAAAPGEGANHA